MTIIKLHKQLTALIKAGHGRKTVCVDKSKCTHALEADGVCIINVTGAEISTHEMADDDGGTKTRANGETCYRTALVITAES